MAVQKGTKLSLGREWVVGSQIGQGGFGRVYAATSGETEAVVKLVPKDPGAGRELLFVQLPDVRNIVPIIDSGETVDEWVLVMPRAEKSLREYLSEAPGGQLSVPDALTVLRDIATALVDLDGVVVHRDLKPDNVLLLDGAWCLADFGISRYAEATTASDTQKFALSAPYAAPERWRIERATNAADVYALGVVAYEMIAGSLPFPGPRREDFREQHLHHDPPRLQGVAPLLGALVDECMMKAPGARPRPASLLARLSRIDQQTPSGGLGRLAEANRAEVERQATAAREQSQARSADDVRQDLAQSGDRLLMRITDELRDAILDAAPSAVLQQSGSGWSLRLNQATMRFSGAERTGAGSRLSAGVPFDVVSHATLTLEIPEDRREYQGRGHSLWFCDAESEGDYAWFETAFMVMALLPLRGKMNPFALAPGEKAASALGGILGEYQVARRFRRLEVGQLDDFIGRWAGWFGDAATGTLRQPMTMPEEQAEGSWRRR